MALRPYRPDPAGFSELGSAASRSRPFDPATATDEEIAAALGLTMPEELPDEPAVPRSRWGNVLQSMAGIEGSDAPYQGPLASLFSGAVSGLGAAGTRAQKTQLRLEEAAQERRVKRDQENLEATRKYRESLTRGRGELLREGRAEERAIAGEGRAETRKMAAEKRDLAGKSDKIKLVEVTNPDGSKTLVPERSGLVTTPKGGADKTKPATEFQAKASLFYGRANEAAAAATEKGLEQRILKKAWGLKAPNVLQDQDQRDYTSAVQAFTLALNRLESGANITPTEFDRVQALYFVQPGDTEVDAKRKASLRQSTVDRLEKLQAPGDRAAAREGLSMPAIPSTWKKVSTP